jgi:hypothetical protein
VISCELRRRRFCSTAASTPTNFSSLGQNLQDGAQRSLTLKQGLCWVYEKYVSEALPEIQTNYWAAQAAAQSNKLRRLARLCTDAALGVAQRETCNAAIAIDYVALSAVKALQELPPVRAGDFELY